MREGKGEPATPGVVHSIKGPVNSGKIYYVETGDDGVTRIRLHRKLIQKKDSGNAFAKHLQAEHLDQQGDHEVFDIKVEKVFKKPQGGTQGEGEQLDRRTNFIRVELNIFFKSGIYARASQRNRKLKLRCTVNLSRPELLKSKMAGVFSS